MSAVLITGGAGYLAQRIARRYLERTDRALLLLVRAKDEAHLAERRAAIEASLGEGEPRVRVVRGDLGDEAPFAAVDPAEVSAIVHAAADIRFNVDEATADRVNVGGTERALAFAERCGGLERFGLIGTVYSCGLRTGRIVEERHDGSAGFANHYERSKWEAEERLLGAHDGLPWVIARVSTVICDDPSGAVTQQNAVHNTFRLLYYGLISTLPGEEDTPLYLVTGELAAEGVFRALTDGPVRTIHHVTHDGDRAPRLGHLVDVVYERFQADEAFKARRVLRPLLVDQEAFEALNDAVQAFSGDVVSQAVDSVAPFSRQLFAPKDIRNPNLCAVLPEAADPDVEGWVRAMADHLVRTRWGRRPEGRT